MEQYSSAAKKLRTQTLCEPPKPPWKALAERMNLILTTKRHASNSPRRAASKCYHTVPSSMGLLILAQYGKNNYHNIFKKFVPQNVDVVLKGIKPDKN